MVLHIWVLPRISKFSPFFTTFTLTTFTIYRGDFVSLAKDFQLPEPPCCSVRSWQGLVGTGTLGEYLRGKTTLHSTVLVWSLCHCVLWYSFSPALLRGWLPRLLTTDFSNWFMHWRGVTQSRFIPSLWIFSQQRPFLRLRVRKSRIIWLN